MKQNFITIILSLIIFILLGPLADSALAASAIITGNVVNIRSGPGINYIKKGTLFKGAVVTVKENRGQWWNISLRSGLSGWVNATYLKTCAGNTAVKLSSATPSTGKLEVTTKIANLRSGPGTTYRIKTKASKGDKLDLLGGTNGWYKVKTSQGIAYILQSLARIWTTEPVYAGEVQSSGQNTTNSQAAVSSDIQTGTDQCANNAPNEAGTSNESINQNSTADSETSDDSNGSTGDNGSQIRLAKIILDAGHGGKDPGALGYRGSMEKDINLILVGKVGSLLEQAGYQIKYTRTDDTFVDLYDRVAIANNEPADLFISIHCNANERSSKRGTAVYYYVDSGKQAPQRELLARTIQNQLINDNEVLIDDGVKQQSFMVIKYTSMPSVLVEIAYISNAYEETLLNDPISQDDFSRSIAKGVKEYLNNPLSRSLIAQAAAGTSDFNSQFDVII